MIEMNEVVVYEKSEDSTWLANVVVDAETFSANPFERGWALRPMRGCGLGANFVSPFPAHISVMFGEGEAENGKKVSAAQMRDEIKRLHPRRFDIRGTQHINAVIQALVRQRKQRIASESAAAMEVLQGRAVQSLRADVIQRELSNCNSEVNQQKDNGKRNREG